MAAQAKHLKTVLCLFITRSARCNRKTYSPFDIDLSRVDLSGGLSSRSVQSAKEWKSEREIVKFVSWFDWCECSISVAARFANCFDHSMWFNMMKHV